MPAQLLTTVADLDQVLGLPRETAPEEPDAPPARPAPGSAARWIFDRLEFDGVARDQLRSRWRGTEQAWAEGLLALELAGMINRLPGGRLGLKVWREG